MAMKVRTDTESKSSKSSASGGSNVTSLAEFKYHARNNLNVKGDLRDQSLTAATLVDTSTIHFNQPLYRISKEDLSEQATPVIGKQQLEKLFSTKAANDPTTSHLLSQDINPMLASWLAAYSFTCQRTKQAEAPFVRLEDKEAHIAHHERMERRQLKLVPPPMPWEWRTRKATLGWSGRPPTELQLRQRWIRKGSKARSALVGMQQRISKAIRLPENNPHQWVQNQPTNRHWSCLTTSTDVNGIANWMRRKEHSRYEFSYPDTPDENSPKIPTSYYFKLCARKRRLSFFNHLCTDDDLKLPTKGDEEVFNRFKSPHEVKALAAKLPTQSNPRTIKLKRDHAKWMQILGKRLGAPTRKQRYKAALRATVSQLLQPESKRQKKERCKAIQQARDYYSYLKHKARSNQFIPYVPVKSLEVGGGTIGCRYEGMWAWHALSLIVDTRKLIVDSLVFDDYWMRYVGWYKSWQGGVITFDELRETAQGIFNMSNECQQPLASTGDKEECGTDTFSLNKRTLFVDRNGVVTDKLSLVTREEAIERGYASPVLMSNRESLIVKDVVLSKKALDSWNSQGYGNVDHFILARGWKKIGALMLPTDPIDNEDNGVVTVELPPAIGRRLSA